MQTATETRGQRTDVHAEALLEVLQQLRSGNFTARMPVRGRGINARIARHLNAVIEMNQSLVAELERVNRVVGKEGKIAERAQLRSAPGDWALAVEAVNSLIDDLDRPTADVSRVISAVALGDLSQDVPLEIDGRPLKGQMRRTAVLANTMVHQLSAFASEVTRVAREVGTEGKLGGQARVRGLSGTWEDLTDNVNLMASNLTGQVRNIAEVTKAVAKGDLTKKITVDVQGEILDLKNTINTMVDQLGSFASEVTRVAREVGTEGKLGGQAEVQGVSGTWKDLTDNVNSMGSNLTAQVRNIAEVTTAVARGDLSKKITVDVRGEILELKNTINTMVDQLGSFASEVTRVAREVGTEGKLGGQADVQGVSGTWKDLTDNVNSMGSNLTAQVRNIAEVTTAVARGDLSKKITVDVRGEILELKNTINTMVDQLGSFASEVTRVAREVGTEGKLGGQADVQGVAGTWKDLTESVNSMASGLTAQVRDIAQVTTAVARGDLSKKITVDVRGEILDLKNTINTMVDQLGSFASEVTRVAREVGTEGKLGGQADVQGVAGTWRDLTDNVNLMASNLTSQVRNIAEVTTAVARGELSKKVTVDVRGEILALKNTVNTMVDQLGSFASEVTRVAREVGTEGKLGGQAEVRGVDGTWKDLTDNVNLMASNLTGQVRNIAEVTTAVAHGDLSKKITVGARGEILLLKNTINTMVDQLSSFAAEVTRVAREVGTEGKLGGQARVQGVAGTWKDLTDNVNSMASNLTAQVRTIAAVVTAVAAGNLRQNVSLQARGEIAALADTINGMIDTLATFADQVTTVAREVGIEGKLGGQAEVPGAAGTWRALTDNVNQLAANLTTQVRAIAEVATAVTKGDLTRSITVQAQGEVAALKDNINQMIWNLRETTRINRDQDWLKTNLARFTRVLQGHRKLETVSMLILSELAPLVAAQYGVFYIVEDSEERGKVLHLLGGYANQRDGVAPETCHMGEGLIGQCALEKSRILLTEVPEGYVQVSSGLGRATAKNVVVLPITFEGDVKAVIELASFHPFSAISLAFLDQLMESIGILINTIEAGMRTETLLAQSQLLAEELRDQQQELTQTNKRLEEQATSLKASEERLRLQQEQLQKTNEELAKRSRALETQNSEVERKNQEIHQAKLSLEERAQQLALSSRYKSEFLANMSHELRSPLNSLLILSKLLAQNSDGNLTAKQVEFADTIHRSGQDLLTLINDILDLSKIESGKMVLELGECSLRSISDHAERTFRQVALERHLGFDVILSPDLPRQVVTDGRRLQQVLENLLNNAFKFTESGKIQLRIASVPTREVELSNPRLLRTDVLMAFSVTDTGVGIAPDKQRMIFEAFNQADGSTSRRYGGTGLGLSISRELTNLLSGEIKVESTPGQGSTFTLYLPPVHLGAADVASVSIVGHSPALEASSEPRLSAAEEEEERLSETNIAALLDEDLSVLVVAAPDSPLIAVPKSLGQQSWGVFSTHEPNAVLRAARRATPRALLLELPVEPAEGLVLLDRLKQDPATRHVPVFVVGKSENELHQAHALGASACWDRTTAPTEIGKALGARLKLGARPVKEVLLIDEHEQRAQQVIELFGNGDVVITVATTVEQAVLLMCDVDFACIIVEDETIAENPDSLEDDFGASVPVVLFAPNAAQESRYPDTGRVESLPQLLDVVSGILGKALSSFPGAAQEIVAGMQKHDPILSGRTILIVDDDERNIFSLASALSSLDIEILTAGDGQRGIETLRQAPHVDLVLLDVMMPTMDGYETAKAIRCDRRFDAVPIVALTAKAMKGDREKCLAAGADGYVAKPVDMDHLISVMRVVLTTATPRCDGSAAHERG